MQRALRPEDEPAPVRCVGEPAAPAGRLPGQHKIPLYMGFAALLWAALVYSTLDAALAAAPYTPDWASLDTRPNPAW